MSRFEFLSVLLSVVLGVAIARILGSWGELIRGRRRVTFFGPHLAWTAFVFVMIVFGWWSAWLARDQAPSFRFGVYLLLLVQPGVVVLAAFLLTPPLPEAGTLDLRAYFLDNARWFFSLLALAALLAIAGSVVRGAFEPALDGLRTAMALLFGGLAAARDARVHRAGATLAFVALLVLVVRAG